MRENTEKTIRKQISQALHSLLIRVCVKVLRQWLQQYSKIFWMASRWKKLKKSVNVRFGGSPNVFVPCVSW